MSGAGSRRTPVRPPVELSLEYLGNGFLGHGAVERVVMPVNETGFAEGRFMGAAAGSGTGTPAARKKAEREIHGAYGQRQGERTIGASS